MNNVAQSGSFDMAIQIPRIRWTIRQLPGHPTIISSQFVKGESLLSPFNFSRLIQQEAERMRHVFIRARSGFELEINVIKERVRRFVNFTYPRLETAVIHGNVVSRLGMQEIFRQCPILRRIELVNFSIVFPRGLHSRALECIVSDKCAIETLESLIRQSPQLNEIVIQSFEVGDDFGDLLAVLSMEKPSIERLDLILPSTDTHPHELVRISEENFTALCQLRLVRWLSIRSGAALSANHIGQLATSMRYIESMKIEVAFVDRDAIVALSGFRWIREISITVARKRSDVDSGMIEWFERQPRLEKIQFGHAIGRALVTAAITQCRHLQSLRMTDVKDIQNDGDAATLIRSLENFPQKHLVIEIELSMASVWDSVKVRDEVDKLNKAACDQSIQLTLLSPKVEQSELVDVQEAQKQWWSGCLIL